MSVAVAATHDVFVCFAPADRAWVEGYLLDALRAASVDVVTEAAFELGVPRLQEFERAMRTSRRILLVLSPAFVADGIATFVESLAQSFGAESSGWPVIPLMLHRVELPPRLAMLTKLDATDSAEHARVIDRLCADLARQVPAAPARPACPYPGMAPFNEAQHAEFFGRSEEVRALLGQLRASRFATVIGPSGSGKSSLVFAGLLPALRTSTLFGRSPLVVRSLRPGRHPLDALAAALGTDTALSPDAAISAALATDGGADGLVIIVDQFEELFTVAEGGSEDFQERLLALSRIEHCYVMLTVRADFYDRLMTAPIWERVRDTRFEVLPLGATALHEAIERPAESVGVYVESALVERLVRDAVSEPGMLPLVQETLVLLWDQLERRFLPLAAYEALVLPRSAYGPGSGTAGRTGLQVAMALRADAALADLASEEERRTAQRIFLRLVQFGEGRTDTRRRQPLDTLRSTGEDPSMFDHVLAHLAARRLITLAADEADSVPSVDLAHEAIITGWPALSSWIAARRVAELTRRRLEAAAAEWVRLGRGDGGLLDATELAEAEQWLTASGDADLGHDHDLDALVAASRTAIDDAESEREAVRQHDLEQARQLAAERGRRLRTTRRLLALLGGLLLVSVGAAALATNQTGRARRARTVAEAQTLAAQATRDADRYQDDVSLVQAALAYNTIDRSTPEVDAALRKVLNDPRRATRTLPTGHGAPAAVPSTRDCVSNNQIDRTSVTFDQAGNHVVSLSRSEGLRRWAASGSIRPDVTPIVGLPTGFVTGGRFAVTRCPDSLLLYDTKDLALSARFPLPKALAEQPFAVAADGKLLVIRDSAVPQQVLSFDLSDPDHPRPGPTFRAAAPIDDVSISPDAHVLTAWSPDRMWLWPLVGTTPAGGTTVDLRVAAVRITGPPHFAFDDGTYDPFEEVKGPPPLGPIAIPGPLVAVPTTTGVHVWALTPTASSARRIDVIAPSGAVPSGVAVLADDARVLAQVSEQSTTVLVSSRKGSVWTQSEALRFRDPVTDLALSPDHRLLATIGANGLARVTTLTPDAPLPPRILDESPGGSAVTGLRVDQANDTVAAWRGADFTRWSSPAGTLPPSLALGAGSEVPGTDVLLADGRAEILWAGPDREVSVVTITRDGTMTRQRLHPSGAELESGAITTDGRFCVADRTGRVFVGELTKLSLHAVASSAPMPRAFVSMFSPDCGLVVRVSSGSERPEVWEIDGQRAARVARFPEGTELGALAFDVPRHVIAYGSPAGDLLVWRFDRENRRPVGLRETGPAVTALAFSSDGRFLAGGDESGTVRVYDRPEHGSGNGRASTPIDVPTSAARVVRLAWGADGQLFFGSGTGEVFRWPASPALAATACSLGRAAVLLDERKLADLFDGTTTRCPADGDVRIP